MASVIIGISAYYHDSAAVILIDDEIIAAAQEERFSRIKHDSSFPKNALKYVLFEAGLSLSETDAVVFYDKPFLTFERLLETSHTFVPEGLTNFLSTIPVWIKDKLFMRSNISNELMKIEGCNKKNLPEILFSEHHLSHSASAFFSSPYQKAAILTIDGVGEWATSTIGYGEDNNIKVLRELSFPHSIGLLYSAFTYFCGFKVNSGEYKLMGLAPFGNPNGKKFLEIKEKIKSNLVDIREDGSILLNMKYFDFATKLKMVNEKKWEKLFGISKRKPESELTQPYMDLALAIQQILEEIVLKMAKTAKKLTGADHLVMAGGVALNCVANGKLVKEKVFTNIWIQPAAGDAGGALGAAYAAQFIWMKTERKVNEVYDNMAGSYLGPSYTNSDVIRLCRKYDTCAEKFDDFDKLCNRAAKYISSGKIVGWFQGRMEWGPRALGNRSILGDPRGTEIQKRINLKIKYREGFRPFAPSVKEESVNKYFEIDTKSPYMLLVAPLHRKHRRPLPEGYEEMDIYKRLYWQRSDVPSITHVDYSARIQTVSKETNYRYWQLIDSFEKITGYGLVVNTSFNVRGEPIVCTPQDAYQCFMHSEMDYLVINDFLFCKKDQPLER